MTSTVTTDETREIEDLIKDITQLRDGLLAQESQLEPMLTSLPPDMRMSARNLVDYLTLRRRDRRHLQERLSDYGLSSLGRAEAYVLANLNAVLSLLHYAVRRTWMPREAADVVTLDEGRRLLDEHTQTLLGIARAERGVRIMVTMPSEAATDYALVRDLLTNGMDVMRVNCAHDSVVEWEQMIVLLRRAQQETGLRCKVLMDLAGPKLRTGPITDGPQLVKWRPQRNAQGQVNRPALVWLTPLDAPEPPPKSAAAQLPLAREFLVALHVGDEIRFMDARDKKRRLRVVEQIGDNCWARAEQTAYVMAGTQLLRMRDHETTIEGHVGELPPLVQTLKLWRGETLIISRKPIMGEPALRDEQEHVVTPARISCTLPEVLDGVKVGEQIWFDDGKIGGVIRTVDTAEVHVEIAQARPQGSKLGASKGINLPDSDLHVAALTGKDLTDLPFVVQHADMVGYSFVRTAHDVRALQQELARLGGEHLGVILKIESRRSFEELPNLLLEVMRSRVAGVVIARGDLAVECGFERLAEVQEEILWLCEAAHMPVIWATQVLESLTRDGMPSRAEVTDAAMAERAECVMLNKGPYVVEAVRTLDDILKRMEEHQSKKRSMLRRLQLAETFFDHVEATH